MPTKIVSLKEQAARLMNSPARKLAVELFGLDPEKSGLEEELAEWIIEQPEWFDLTLGELKTRYPGVGRWRSMIASSARQAYARSGRPLECAECGYRKHVDICHIEEVKSFSNSDKVGLINALDNLKPLCKTHHWEFDHPDYEWCAP